MRSPWLWLARRERACARAPGMWHVSGMFVACVWYVCARAVCGPPKSWKVNEEAGGGWEGADGGRKEAERNGQWERGEMRR